MIAPSAVGNGRVVRWPLSSAMPPMGALLSAPGAARGYVRRVLTEWHLSAVADDCALVVSELVTNALIAYAGPGGGPRYVDGRLPLIRVCIVSDARHVVIEVYDEAAGVPGIRDIDPETDEPGHGLHMVQTLTSGQWGWTPQHGKPGKCVWAALPLPALAPQSRCPPVRSPAAIPGCRLLTAPRPRGSASPLPGTGAITSRAPRGQPFPVHALNDRRRSP
jgi:anti-sigma regulatory factor (Ser/Thr protein kinase)